MLPRSLYMRVPCSSYLVYFFFLVILGVAKGDRMSVQLLLVKDHGFHYRPPDSTNLENKLKNILGSLRCVGQLCFYA